MISNHRDDFNKFNCLSNDMIFEVYRSHPWRHGYPADIRHPVGGFRRPVPSGLRVLEAGNPLSPSAATGTNSGPKNMKFLNFGPLPRLTRQKSALAKILRSNGDGGIIRGLMINDIRAIWSSYKMMAYIMIFVHNDRLRTVHDDIQTVKIDIQ